jgi:error-prone DNA polymerase
MLAERDARAFASMEDFLVRTNFVAAERRALASAGALNALASHRRAALWQVEAAWEAEEGLLRGVGCGAGFTPGMAETAGVKPVPREEGPDKAEAGGDACATPLAPMTREERVQADFGGTGLTIGVHPMRLARERLKDAWCAAELPLGRDGERVKIAGSVICRQRPGTAKGVVFVSLEDETGIANAIVPAELFERLRLTINEEPALCIAGRLQIQQGVIHVRAETIEALRLDEVPAQASHDFR